jgi:hypothetical protein
VDDEVETGTIGVAEEVLVQQLTEGESVLLHLGSEEYFGLDPTGTAMWTALTEIGDVHGAAIRLAETFDVELEVVRRDLDAFLRQLMAHGLLRHGTATP